MIGETKMKPFEELASNFFSKTGVGIPQEIIDFHRSNPNLECNLKIALHRFEKVKIGEKFEELELLITEKFAKAIISEIENLSAEEKRILMMEGEVWFGNEPQNEFHLWNEHIFDYLASYAVHFYEPRSNCFPNPIIQKAFEKLQSNKEVFRLMIITSMDCSGCKGVILVGKNCGCSTWYNHSVNITLERGGYAYDFLVTAPIEWETNYVKDLQELKI